MLFRLITLVKEIRQVFVDAAAMREAMSRRHTRMGE